MLAVLIVLLKIIGILLLSILGFLLLSVLLLMFVPIRYRIVVKRSGLEGDPPANAKIRVTWFLHILNIHVNYPSEIYVRVRLFIFTLFKLPDKKREQKQKARAEKKKKLQDESAQKEEKAEKAEADAVETTLPKEAAAEGDASGETVDEMAETPEKAPKKNILHTIRAFYDKIKGMIQQIRDKIIHIRDTVQSAKDHAAHYLTIMESKAFNDSLHLALGELAGILKSIGPKKCRIYIEEGMDDPATTASVLAVYGMFYPWLYDKVTVVGNFEEQIIKADVFIKGRITVFRIVYAGIKIYFNKQVKTLIRMFKKEDKS